MDIDWSPVVSHVREVAGDSLDTVPPSPTVTTSDLRGECGEYVEDLEDAGLISSTRGERHYIEINSNITTIAELDFAVFDDVAYLHRIIVFEGLQRNGIGRELAQHALDALSTEVQTIYTYPISADGYAFTEAVDFAPASHPDLPSNRWYEY